MKTDVLTVNQLFVGDVRYEVPLYQRPYVWEQDRHWEPLWEDLELLLGSQLDGAPRRHFLGAIVVQEQSPQPGRVVRIRCRWAAALTTLQLVLATAHRAISEMAQEGSARLLARLITARVTHRGARFARRNGTT